MLRIEDTVANQIQVLDDGTSVADIMYALGWVQREQERSRKKYLKKKEGQPPKKIGRPRKTSPAGLKD